MHSSRMHTVRNSSRLGEVYLVAGGVPGPGECTWSQRVYLVLGGVPGPGGVPGLGGVLGLGGVPGPGGGTCPGTPLLWTDTHM